MLGLADRALVFDLLDAVMADSRPALQVTELAYERGADLGTLLQDLLELIYTVSGSSRWPSLRDSQELPEAGAHPRAELAIASQCRSWAALADAAEGRREVELAPPPRRGGNGADPPIHVSTCPHRAN